MNTKTLPLRTTSRDIALRAGVSQATVSRALAGHAAVRGDTRDRVMAAAQELGYRPNGHARAMRTSRTGTIGVVVSRLTNPLYPQLLQALGRSARQAGLRLMIWNSDDTDDRSAVDAVRENVVDGIIMATATAERTSMAEDLRGAVPLVLINRTVAGWPCDQVTSDNYSGGRDVATYLARAGRKRIALMSGPESASTVRDREAGFRQTLDALQVPLYHCLNVRVDSITHEAGRRAAEALFDLVDPPDAVFCIDDVLAMGVLDFARTRSIAVPDDLWVVGYDDIEMAGWAAYDLTTVRQPLEIMAAEAMRFLAARIDGDRQPFHDICLPNPLVIRGSTGWRPASEPGE